MHPMGQSGGELRKIDLEVALQIHSPYDVEARFSTKREMLWAGYKVHLTETCDEKLPHLITHVETTPATTYDGAVTETIHTALEAKALLPEEHIVDSPVCGSFTESGPHGSLADGTTSCADTTLSV